MGNFYLFLFFSTFLSLLNEKWKMKKNNDNELNLDVSCQIKLYKIHLVCTHYSLYIFLGLFVCRVLGKIGKTWRKQNELKRNCGRKGYVVLLTIVDNLTLYKVWVTMRNYFPFWLTLHNSTSRWKSHQ